MSRNDDRGVALIAVISLGVIMMLLISTGLAVATSGLRQADTDQDSSGAMDAAYAGVQDYLARINLNSNYVQYGNSAAPFSSGSTLTELRTNPAFGFPPSGTTGTGLGTIGTWAAVPGSGGNASFRYEVDNSTFATAGVLRLRSTGRVGTVTRSIVSSFRVRGFIDYTYFTDYEIQDPQISGVDQTLCVKHAWEGRTTAKNPDGTYKCPNIQFGAFDSLNGRVHSNDTMVICGATFSGTVTTANPNTPIYSTTDCTSTKAATVTRAAQLPMPATNTTMRSDARCLYTGPTQITYNNDSTSTSPGTMTVVSPWTNYTTVSGTTGSNTPSVCGSPSDLRSSAGAKVPQLDANALYVQSVPSTTTDPNYWNSSLTPTGITCLGADAKDTTNGNGAGWSLTASGTTTRYPLTSEYPAVGWRTTSDSGTVQWSTATPAYGCRSGDLFVKGVVSVATTAASENYTYITGDVTYLDRTQDVLGIVGQNAVLVWNPVTSSGAALLTAKNREVDAALISVARTFQVQNYSVGSARGTLTVFGSIAQKFRGPVATASGSAIATGYSKAYTYDPLLGVVSPPKFLAPTAVSFTLQRYASVPAAFLSTGVTR